MKLLATAVISALFTASAAPGGSAVNTPSAALSPSLPLLAPTAPRREVAVLAGGCFWGVEAVYEHLKGVIDVVSGYSGGSKSDAEYESVGSGRTGHAESVRVTFDPDKITYAKILEVFFAVAHDPTQLNRQGPDVGTQYRSAIFYGDSTQERVAREVIAKLTANKAYDRPIVTQVVPLKAFFMAEPYHQDFAAHNPTHPYIVYHDLPKVEHLRKSYPELYRDAGM